MKLFPYFKFFVSVILFLSLHLGGFLGTDERTPTKNLLIGILLGIAATMYCWARTPVAIRVWWCSSPSYYNPRKMSWFGWNSCTWNSLVLPVCRVFWASVQLCVVRCLPKNGLHQKQGHFVSIIRFSICFPEVWKDDADEARSIVHEVLASSLSPEYSADEFQCLQVQFISGATLPKHQASSDA